MPDLSLLNHAVADTWGDDLQVSVGGVVRPLRGVFVESYDDSPVISGEQRPGPAVECLHADWLAVNGQAGALVTHAGVTYTVTGDPRRLAAGWCALEVRHYGG